MENDQVNVVSRDSFAIAAPEFIETASSPESDLVRLRRWRASTFWVMLLGYVGYYLCRSNLSYALPLLSEAFHYSNAQLGLIGLYSELAYAVGKFVNGSLADHIGGKKVFLLGMAGAIFFNVIFTLSSGLTFFVVTWCACRFFLSMGWGGIIKTIGTWYEKEVHGTVMGWISVNFQFGGVVGALLCSYLVARNSSWQGLFLIPAMILSVIWIWSYLCSKESPQDVVPGTQFGNHSKVSQGFVKFSEAGEKAPVMAIIKGLMKSRIFRQNIVFNMLTTILRVFFFFWTPKILVDIGMGTANAIVKSAVFPLLGCAGTILIGWYTDKYVKNGDRARMMWIMLVGLVLSLAAVTFLISSGMQHSTAIITLLGAAGFFLYGPYSMSAGALALDIAGPEGAATASGILDGMGYAAASVALWAAGRMADANGNWTQVFMVTILMAAISAYSAFVMSKELRRTHNSKNYN